MKDVEVFGFSFSRMGESGNYQIQQSQPNDDEYNDHTIQLSKYDIIVLLDILKELVGE